MSLERARLRSTDVLVALLAAALLVALCSGYVTSTFARMYADFGTRSNDLPTTTRIAVSAWFRWPVTIACAAPLVLGLRTVRSWLLTVAFLATAAVWTFEYFALYSPIWALTSHIR